MYRDMAPIFCSQCSAKGLFTWSANSVICRKSADFSADFATKNVILIQIWYFFTIVISAALFSDQTT